MMKSECEILEKRSTVVLKWVIFKNDGTEILQSNYGLNLLPGCNDFYFQNQLETGQKEKLSRRRGRECTLAANRAAWQSGSQA